MSHASTQKPSLVDNLAKFHCCSPNRHDLLDLAYHIRCHLGQETPSYAAAINGVSATAGIDLLNTRPACSDRVTMKGNCMRPKTVDPSS